MKALVIYDSLSGNTEKVAGRIYETLRNVLSSVYIVKITNKINLDLLGYDLIFIGSPVIDWLPTKTMIDYIQRKLKDYNNKGLIQPAAPIIPGKFCACFGTFGGPHIGINEAKPMTMWLRSALEHIGFMVLDEWHVPGQFLNKPELNRCGRLGNIEGRPDEHDLSEIENKVKGILGSLTAWY